MTNKQIIKCNKCRRIIGKTNPKWKKTGDIEYYYLQCNWCKEVYVISATDTALRNDIKRYKEMTEKTTHGRKLTEKELSKAKELFKANMERNREIKKQHPLKLEQ